MACHIAESVLLQISYRPTGEHYGGSTRSKGYQRQLNAMTRLLSRQPLNDATGVLVQPKAEFLQSVQDWADRLEASMLLATKQDAGSAQECQTQARRGFTSQAVIKDNP
jgi:hypothetical protein